MIKLDLGAGERSPEGYRPMGHGHGSEIYPLPYEDGTVDVIRASHVLEHFPHSQVPAVLADWVRALKPGGELRIAVPDFKSVAERYLAGQKVPTESFVMGGQTDADDFHKALFDETHLRRLMGEAGVVLLRRWQSELGDDCSALQISLNLAGTKPYVSSFGATAVMSLPRVTWTANSLCAIEALPPLGIGLRSYTGAYWGQCLERSIEDALSDNHDAILTLDYDTVFSRRDVSMLMQLMMVYPDADAIAAIQSGRGTESALFTKRVDGKPIPSMAREDFIPDLAPVSTAHFGLTLIRTEKLRTLPKPWFHDQPSPNGDWNDGRVDADIGFWRKWEAAGNSLFIANRVAVGHLDLMVRWPGQDLQAIYQPHDEWRRLGPPEGIWS